MADGISGMSDADFLAMAQNLAVTVTGSPTTYGLTALFATDLTDQVNDFQAELQSQVEKQAMAKAQTIVKNEQRAVVEAALREARLLARAAKVSEATYAQMGLPSASDPAPPNATVPAAAVDTSERFRHTISWTDAATLGNKKKPIGVMGAEIWLKIDGPPPADESECTFLTLDAFTPFVALLKGDSVGKTAHYMLRWRMRDGSVSAWGETVSATITG